MIIQDKAYVIPYEWHQILDERIESDRRRETHLTALFYLTDLLNLWREQEYPECVRVSQNYFRVKYGHHYRKVLRILDVLERASLTYRGGAYRMDICLNTDEIPYAEWWYSSQINV